MADKKYRLVTRSDFDGLVCAVILKTKGLIDEIKFAHPKDMQDGKIAITDRDITTNLPYVKEAHLVFDHHLSETLRIEGTPKNHIIDPDAPSAARVVYDYYGGEAAFPNISLEMMDAVDTADSAQFTSADIIYPEKWALLSFIMDSRTGLGRFHDFEMSNYDLMMDLIDRCTTLTIEEILELPEVKARIDFCLKNEPNFYKQLNRCATVYDNVVVLNLLEEEVIYPGNRFKIYTIFPACNVSIHMIWGLNKQNIVLAVGKSILNKTSPVNIGELMLEYGGGGHQNAGTCQIEIDKAKAVCQEIVARINEMSE
ncbi:MAG: exopolyphosphatase [Sporomusaceae bacterium]|jgi:nanoRNase/pAp phosphatase (c-di-AMP/oligoRNAs hydrolase)|nr:exopolyphosphatase [Sporomusaceae bacterium]